MGKLQKIKYSAERQNHGHFDENVLVPKFKEFAIWLEMEGSHQPFAFADPFI